RILVVEDETRLSSFLRRGFQSAGYAVDTAYTGIDAIDRAQSTEYDLVVLDLGLPDIDGVHVLKEIKNREGIPPVLILSARSSVDDRVRGLEQGADDYLVKPFSFDELLARARVLLRRGQPTPDKLQVGDLMLDCIRRKVTRNNENIELDPRQFSILEYMMRNRGRPLSRTMIVEHVWDMDYDGLTNIVDVYIRHLRSKIDDKFPTKLIHTVRGIGYMLDAPHSAGQDFRAEREGAISDLVPRLRLFLSYAHRDEKDVNELRKDLKLMERNGLIQTWSDHALTAGEKWEHRIVQELQEADVIVCQLSRDFLASDFCVLKELQVAIERKLAGEAELIAYVLKDCGWKEVPALSQFQVIVPARGRGGRDKYWRAVADGIQQAVKKLQEKRTLRSHP
ncbi:MAG: response regulator, partial [Acidobacteriaceae bacterium]|nr:response regulator [Acidobacteriaceae bacterium]